MKKNGKKWSEIRWFHFTDGNISYPCRGHNSQDDAFRAHTLKIGRDIRKIRMTEV